MQSGEIMIIAVMLFVFYEDFITSCGFEILDNESVEVGSYGI